MARRRIHFARKKITDVALSSAQLSDFKRVLKNPRLVFLGFACQVSFPPSRHTSPLVVPAPSSHPPAPVPSATMRRRSFRSINAQRATDCDDLGKCGVGDEPRSWFELKPHARNYSERESAHAAAARGATCDSISRGVHRLTRQRGVLCAWQLTLMPLHGGSSH